MGGRLFAGARPYQKLSGRVRFAFDPANPANRRIVDLDKAPRNGKGLVEASANFMVLRPKAPCRPHCVGLLEVSNRGSKAALAYFNGAAFSNNPSTREEFGDGLLMRRGLTLIWVGWQFDVPPGDDRLRIEVPIATDHGRPIRGLVRSDWTVDEPVTSLPLAHRGHIAYRVADVGSPKNVLTVRQGRLGERRVVPRTQWRFAGQGKGEVSGGADHIYKPDGFKPGHIYELVYVAQGPAVVGLGLAAVRDMMAYAKFDQASPFHVDHGIAFGVSQTGRFLRHFVYQGFNTDEAGRKVFDGLFIHAAGAGRGSFNHRFAQPSRDAHRYSSFFYPTDLFPFSGRRQTDPETGRRDGLFHGPVSLWPKVFYINTGYEYWGRAAALIHTTVTGDKDIAPLPNERIYHLASAQHFPVGLDALEPIGGVDAYRGNPLDFLVTLRALMVRLADWVVAGRAPPDSRYPRIENGTLVPVDKVRFPAVPTMPMPAVAHQAYRLDFGSRWAEGIIDREPPRLGAPFATLVPQVDDYGNELGGVRMVELRVPLASYFPWNLRSDFAHAREELVDFYGTWIPFAKSPGERRSKGDPRPSVAALYPSRDAYLSAVHEAVSAMRSEGFLLLEDSARVTRRAGEIWGWVQGDALQ